MVSSQKNASKHILLGNTYSRTAHCQQASSTESDAREFDSVTDHCCCQVSQRRSRQRRREVSLIFVAMSVFHTDQQPMRQKPPSRAPSACVLWDTGLAHAVLLTLAQALKAADRGDDAKRLLGR